MLEPGALWLRGLRERAHALGFDAVRVLPARTAPHHPFFLRWLARGNAGAMHYLERGADARANPRWLSQGQPELRTVLVLAIDFHRHAVPENVLRDPKRGRIARYAWRIDYHDVIRPRLIELDQWLRSQSGRAVPGKAFVDAGPVLERDFAALSGLSFVGKNTMSIVPGRGSHHFLATLSVPELLPFDPVIEPKTEPGVDQVIAGLAPATRFPIQTLAIDGELRTGTCGACARCLVACPTEAFVGPFHLDARRCISYWTIEAKTLAPAHLRPGFGNWIFGCDICQDVCPWNHTGQSQGPRIPELQERSEWIAPLLLQGFAEDTPYWVNDRAFQAHFRASPMRRAKRMGMLRNVCIALGNSGDPDAMSVLVRVFHSEQGVGESAAMTSQAVVRAAALWAMVQLSKRGVACSTPWSELLADERDPSVLAEFQSCTAGADGP